MDTSELRKWADERLDKWLSDYDKATEQEYAESLEVAMLSAAEALRAGLRLTDGLYVSLRDQEALRQLDMIEGRMDEALCDLTIPQDAGSPWPEQLKELRPTG